MLAVFTVAKQGMVRIFMCQSSDDAARVHYISTVIGYFSGLRLPQKLMLPRRNLHQEPRHPRHNCVIAS